MSRRHTFVIAEAAGCHDGSLDAALGLVDIAASIGADAVKFQWTSSPERLVARRNAPEYLDAYRNLAFPREWHEQLVTGCQYRGLEYMCTTYLPEDIAVVAPYVSCFKVSSFESLDRHFVMLHAEFQKPLILSTGMSRSEDHQTVVTSYHSSLLNSGPGGPWTSKCPDWCEVLHCVSAYPCPPEQMNLSVLRKAGYGGISDHTRHPWVGALAVAAGARVVEFHVRGEATSPDNPDYAVSRSPHEAREYVAAIRFAEGVVGDGDKRVMSAEEPMLRYRVRGTGR